MELNLGIVSDYMTKNFVDSFINESEDKNVLKLMNIIKESPILSKEYLIFKNIENKTIKNDIIASNYIGDNIGIMADTKYIDIVNEHKKFDQFEIDTNLEEDKIKLYEAINNLIIENSIKKGIKAVDKIHESLEYVLSYLKSDKQQNLNESNDLDEEYKGYEELYIHKLIDNYNNEYKNITESEYNIYNSVINNLNVDDKKVIFENLKTSTLEKINEKIEETTDTILSSKLEETYNKLDKFQFCEEKYLENCLKIFELNSDLDDDN